MGRGDGKSERTQSVDAQLPAADERLALANTEGFEGDASEDAVSRPEVGEPPLPVGSQVGEYVVKRVLGSGGFGTVYEAVQPAISKRAAIKVLATKYSFDAKAVSRFVAEARITNQIGHPNIVGVFSFGRLDDGRHYHVMDFVSGETLEGLIERRGALPLAEALPILRGIASALDAAHRQQIVHRDLKPANVVLADHGDSIAPKVIDFGVAKLLGEEPKVAKTRSGALIGTPLYMSPEQCRGRNVDQRSDVYSFGVLMYEILTGRPPFEGKDAVDLLLSHTSEAPLPPSRVKGLPAPLGPAVDEIVLSLLAKDPAKRPAKLGEVLRSLESPSPSVVPPRAAPRTRPWLMVAGVVGALAVVAAAQRVSSEAPAAAGISAAIVPLREPPPVVSTQQPARTEYVRVEIVGPPAGTEVHGPDGRLLGTLPGSIQLARSDSPVTLELNRRGYGKLSHAVTPKGDLRVALTLPSATKPKPSAPAPSPDETEKPKW
ncbi:MAG: hypothetical protein AMXMBFR56_80040 [Polyangiaceae bacterium]